MWRTVKALAVLVTVTFGFWAAVQGDLPPWVAFVGMVLAILGAEGLENALAAVGTDGLDGVAVTLDPGGEGGGTDGDSDATDTDGAPPEREREFHEDES